MDATHVRWLGSCDVPDLDLFPLRYPSLRTVAFHAGVASVPGHFAVWLAWFWLGIPAFLRC